MPKQIPTGEISSGTLKTIDLAGIFIGFLETYRPRETEEIKLGLADDLLVLLKRHDYGYGDKDDLMDDITELLGELVNETLWDLLANNAPEGYYFGTHPGDGALFGYWPIELIVE